MKVAGYFVEEIKYNTNIRRFVLKLQTMVKGLRVWRLVISNLRTGHGLRFSGSVGTVCGCVTHYNISRNFARSRYLNQRILMVSVREEIGSIFIGAS